MPNLQLIYISSRGINTLTTGDSNIIQWVASIIYIYFVTAEPNICGRETPDRIRVHKWSIKVEF